MALVLWLGVGACGQTPAPVDVPVRLCVWGRAVSETVTMAWQPEMAGYLGASSRIMTPGMYEVTVASAVDSRDNFRLMLGEAVPEMWVRDGDNWVASAVHVGKPGPLQLWQAADQPLQSLSLTCEPNLAAARFYRTDPAPNWRLGLPGTCTDVNDRVQLVDGRVGSAWPDQIGTVAWQNVNEVSVYIDLGREFALTRVYCNVAGGGMDGVGYPASVKVEGAMPQVRQLPFPQPGRQTGPATNRNFFLLGQWLTSNLAEPEEQASQRIRIDVTGRARYLRIRFVTGRSRMLATDEIEVY